MAARVRTLADAVHDLTLELQLNRVAVARMDVARLDGRARQVADRATAALELLNRNLAITNTKLAQLASRPIVGFLGGGAEAEINRLVGSLDAFTREVAAWRQLVD
jgi:hypothetical protein